MLTEPGDFTNQAAAYAAARPTYPEAFIDELAGDAGVKRGDHVVDIGAGTGISTTLLASRGFVVTAVEPNAEMRRHAPSLPRTTWVDGTFEALPLAGGSQAWAVAAQAFHWAEPRKALPEVRRVLRAGGWFTVFWNDRDMDGGAILRQTQQLIQELVPGFDEAYRARDWAAILTSTGDFDAVRAFEYRHVVSMSRERYLMLWRSHNRLSAAAGATLNELLRRIERMLERGGVSEVDVPYVCRAWSVRRRD